jgi:periplasmic copper chaperone A
LPKPKLTAWVVATLLSVLAGQATAQITVDDPWVRGTVPGQQTTGAFMRITSPTDATLVDITTPAAKIAEIHATRTEGGVLKMGSVANLPLPAGVPVDLQPGGYHVMLMDLTQPLKEGEWVVLTLTVADSLGKTQQFTVLASVRPLGAR